MGAAVARAPAKKKKKTGALVIAAAASLAGSAGVASAGSEDVQSSSVPLVDVRVKQPKASTADPMPNIFGGLYSSSKEGTEVALQHAPSSPAIVVPSPVPAADIGQPEAVLAEQALAARSSSSPSPARPLAEEIQPFGPSLHDMAETSAQGAR